MQKLDRDGVASLIKYVLVNPVVGAFVSITENQNTCFGVELSLDNNQIDLATKGLIAREEYEREEIELLRTHLPSDTDVLELGAGIGFLSGYVNRRLGNSQTHVVVEPNEKLLPTLKQNKQINGCDFVIHEGAYAPATTTVDFHLQDSFKISSVHQNSQTIIQVEGVNLETLAEEYALSEFILIVDIEGAEAELLDAEFRYLENHCRMLFIEYHYHYNNNPDAVRRAKRRLDNSVFILVEELDNLAVYKNPTL